MVDFLGIGAQKAGTSYVHNVLRQSPEVLFPNGKEVHYWDWVQFGKTQSNIDWYRHVFSPVAGKRLGDMTPDYSALNEHWVEQVHQAFPDARVFMLLRNPVERAWSALRMFIGYCQFNDELPSVNWQLEVLRSAGLQRRSDYLKTLKIWRRRYAGDSCRVFLYDDLQVDPEALLRDLCAHIGVSPEFIGQLDDQVLSRRVRVGSGVRPCQAVVDQLFHSHQQRVEELADYLNVDLSHWLDRDRVVAGLSPD